MSVPTHTVTNMLTDTEARMLDLEASWWKYAGAKEAHILAAFDMTATRYYQVLSRLIERPEALAAQPMTVRRLLRLRDERRALRREAVR